MYSQSFSPKNLYACTTQAERRNSGRKKDEFIEAIENELGGSLLDGTYKFKIKECGELYLNGRGKKDFDCLCQDLVLRKLYRNIKRIYSVQQADRNSIVNQMKLLLAENVDMWVIRLDVKHFYESIDCKRIVEKMFNDARLSYHSLVLLKSLFDNPVVSTCQGLPRGLGVSAAMSEMYMKYFDFEVKRIDGVYYYARFVDDIIVFCSSEKSSGMVWERVKKELTKLGLELNKEKSYNWTPSSNGSELTYLGYSFMKQNGQVVVKMAQKKINVIKTRIARTFVRFAKDHNQGMLILRLKFLTGNFTLYQSHTLTPIKVGLFFNYKMATDISALDELDRFYQRLLHCQRGRLGSRIGLTKGEMKSLEKYSFRFGYENHVNHHFTIDQIIRITNCWR